MAQAIAKGLLHNKSNQLQASAPSLAVGINDLGIKTNSDNLAVIADADVIILAVKPTYMATVLTEISANIPHHCLVISIAAGLSLPWFAKRIANTALVRAMPNMAAALGKSATPLIANHLVTEEQKQWTEQIFSSIGLYSWTKHEFDMDAFTALSGSGPAYIFMFMEAMIKAAVSLGIAENIAHTFALQTFKGSLSLITESKLSLHELRKSVTSPAGTTAAAIEVLTQHGFDELIFAAMKAASDRAAELGLTI